MQRVGHREDVLHAHDDEISLSGQGPVHALPRFEVLASHFSAFIDVAAGMLRRINVCLDDEVII